MVCAHASSDWSGMLLGKVHGPPLRLLRREIMALPLLSFPRCHGGGSAVRLSMPFCRPASKRMLFMKSKACLQPSLVRRRPTGWQGSALPCGLPFAGSMLWRKMGRFNRTRGRGCCGAGRARSQASSACLRQQGSCALGSIPRGLSSSRRHGRARPSAPSRKVFARKA
jgi:hypothetical protein